MAATTMLRLFATFARPTPVVASIALHIGAIAAGGHAAVSSGDVSSVLPAQPTFEIDLEPSPSEPPPKAEPALANETALPAPRAVATHRHPYPVLPSHDARPHDPSTVHVPIAPARQEPLAPQEPPSVAALPDDAPVHFTMPAGRAVASGNGVAMPIATAGAAREAAGPPVTYEERDVSEPARLRASAPVVYPPEARGAEIEADVAVDLVVDAHGDVVDARSASTAGYGLEQAAVRAVRAYHFSPAIRRGGPVAVRMRWTVSFRLR